MMLFNLGVRAESSAPESAEFVRTCFAGSPSDVLLDCARKSMYERRICSGETRMRVSQCEELLK
jgi:hypothetical protein